MPEAIENDPIPSAEIAVENDRREILCKIGLGTAAVATGGILASGLLNFSAAHAHTGDDEAIRMREELRVAMRKPVDQRKWAMVIDTRRCIGCHACTVACVAENNLPPGVQYRTVPEAWAGEYPTPSRFFMPTNCYQCENPPCVAAANAVVPGAMSQRPDGVVSIDYAKAKGRAVFDAAKAACPYTGALYFDGGGNHTDGTPAVQAYERRAPREYGAAQPRAATSGSMRKCHFCLQRVEAGVLPACVSTCTGRAMFFGDRADSSTLVSRLASDAGKTFVLNEAAGTKPRVIYLHEAPSRAEASCGNCHG